jgi:hypothetical protein
MGREDSQTEQIGHNCTIVRKQCATVRKSDEPGINAQDGTLQNVTGFPCGVVRKYSVSTAGRVFSTDRSTLAGNFRLSCLTLREALNADSGEKVLTVKSAALDC